MVCKLLPRYYLLDSQRISDIPVSTTGTGERRSKVTTGRLVGVSEKAGKTNRPLDSLTKGRLKVNLCTRTARCGPVRGTTNCQGTSLSPNARVPDRVEVCTSNESTVPVTSVTPGPERTDTSTSDPSLKTRPPTL